MKVDAATGAGEPFFDAAKMRAAFAALPTISLLRVRPPRRSDIGLDVYRIKLDGTGLAKLTQKPGMHSAAFSRGLAHFFDRWSDVNTPQQVRVSKADGTEVRLVHESRISQLAELKLSTPELLQVKARDGFVMEAMLIRPPDFNPTRKYPVMQFTYGGPGSQSVTNGWGGVMGMRQVMLDFTTETLLKPAAPRPITEAR